MGTVDWQSVLSVAKDLVDEIEWKIERRVENKSIPFLINT
jgi:hypothetical protein